MNRSNKAFLTGIIEKEPVVTEYDDALYKSTICIRRLSKASDHIPILLPKHMITEDMVGKTAAITGQVRSMDCPDKEPKLLIGVYARRLKILDGAAEHKNIIILEGFLCRQPHIHVTQSRRKICDFMLAVNRKHRINDYIPCIAWAENADFINSGKISEKFIVTGRIQSREYTKKFPDGTSRKNTAYEVSCSKTKHTEN